MPIQVKTRAIMLLCAYVCVFVEVKSLYCNKILQQYTVYGLVERKLKNFEITHCSVMSG